MNETVADRIKRVRIENNLSQEELAKRAGYSDKSAISKLEHSGNDITMKQIKRVAIALDVTSSFLMGWDDGANAGQNKNDEAMELYKQYESLSPENQAAFRTLLKSLQS